MLRLLFYCALFFYFIMDDLLRKCSSFFLAGLNYMGLVIELYYTTFCLIWLVNRDADHEPRHPFTVSV